MNTVLLVLGQSALNQAGNIIQAPELVSAADVRAIRDLIFTECMSIQK